MEEVYSLIQSSHGSVAERLEFLRQQGFLEADMSQPPKYRYRPADQELEQSVSEVKTLYRQRRVKVVEAIYAIPEPVRDFANAFRLRKDESNG